MTNSELKEKVARAICNRSLTVDESAQAAMEVIADLLEDEDGSPHSALEAAEQLREKE